MFAKVLESASKKRRGAIRRKVLIIDDDEAMTDVLSIRLSRQGFDSCTANNGQLALTLARTDKPSIILLDLCLPDIDGFELCQQLVDDEATSETPVIIVSGLEGHDVIRRSRAAGCLYYVRKPYDPNALLTLIEQALEGSQQG
jgi:DNA-binding response OmpR family regulator